jgi:5-aminolevulinate synthase
MEALLRQSRAVCPFLKTTTPQTLRSLSTTAAVGPAGKTVTVSPGGGSMSNLQLLARRCPLMGKAMSTQSARHGKAMSAVYRSAAAAGAREYHGKAAAAKNKAFFHNNTSKEARAVEIVQKETGMLTVL